MLVDFVDIITFENLSKIFIFYDFHRDRILKRLSGTQDEDKIKYMKRILNLSTFPSVELKEYINESFYDKDCYRVIYFKEKESGFSFRIISESFELRDTGSGECRIYYGDLHHYCDTKHNNYFDCFDMEEEKFALRKS